MVGTLWARMMNERVVAFGDGGRLSGIVSVPESPERQRPPLVVLNSGLIHRVGVGRVSVNLGRHVASRGTFAFRFDFAGIGDSGPRPSGVDLDASHRADTKRALDFLQAEFGMNRFVLYGLCSGARDAFNAALEDSRVVGIVQLDGFAYRTPRYYWTHYSRRVLQPGAWAGFVRKTLRRAGASSGLTSRENSGGDMVVEMWPEYPPRKAVEDGYRRLVDRGVRILALYTGSWDDQYNYRTQFFHMYPGVDFGTLLDLRFMPEAVHVLPDPEMQARVIDLVDEWIRVGF